MRARRALLAFMMFVVIVRVMGGGMDYASGFLLGVMFGMFLSDDMHERVRGG